MTKGTNLTQLEASQSLAEDAEGYDITQNCRGVFATWQVLRLGKLTNTKKVMTVILTFYIHTSCNSVQLKNTGLLVPNFS